MRHFAEVLDAPQTLTSVRAIITCSDDAPEPVFAPGTVKAVEVTDLDPRPAEGWLFDSVTETFAPPPASHEGLKTETPSDADEQGR
jgi:hypothetical protein